MALPHMPSVYTTRKNMYEAAIVRRRTHEDDFRENWKGTAAYFNSADVRSSKDATWTSKATFQSSMDAYKKNYVKDTKALNLARRQSKLASLLQREKDEYEAELRGYSPDNYSRLSEMKERSESLRSAREEKRRGIAEEKLYEHFRQNCPDMRKLESEQHKNHVIDKWSDQKAERQQAFEEEQRQKQEFEAKMEAERLAALEIQKEMERKRLENELKVKDVLKQQISELQEKEKEAEMLKGQQDELLRHQWELERLEEKRNEMEAERKKQELGRVLLRQHTAHMRRKSKQIMEELEQDRQLLEAVLEKEADEVAIQTARRKKAHADAMWMKEVIEDQLRLEREREAELDMLYQDEAARLWNQREQEWNRERQAREKLMKDVLAGRQEQIEMKIEVLHQQQQESLVRREELLQDIERANELTQRERVETQRQKEVQADQLAAQVSARREQQEMGVLDEISQIETEKKAEQDYEQLLKQEAERLRIQGYQPQIHSRRRGRSAWQ